MEGAIRDCLQSPAPRLVSDTYAQVARGQSKSHASTSGACHLQHVVCYVVGRDSSAVRFDRAEISFLLVQYIVG